MEYFRAWREADRAALEAETHIYAASMAFINGRGPEPTAKEVKDAHCLRRIADDLFVVAMREMQETSESLRCSASLAER